MILFMHYAIDLWYLKKPILMSVLFVPLHKTNKMAMCISILIYTI